MEIFKPAIFAQVPGKIINDRHCGCPFSVTPALPNPNAGHCAKIVVVSNSCYVCVSVTPLHQQILINMQ